MKPCPFCGGPAGIAWMAFGTICSVMCPDINCGGEGPPKSTEEEAIAAWNERKG